jgi:hypothetical protein
LHGKLSSFFSFLGRNEEREERREGGGRKEGRQRESRQFHRLNTKLTKQFLSLLIKELECLLKGTKVGSSGIQDKSE